MTVKSVEFLVSRDRQAFAGLVPQDRAYGDAETFSGKPQLTFDPVISHTHLGLVMAMCSSCTKLEGDTVRVLDIGGQLGVHYSQATALVPGKTFFWTIMETSACVQVAKSHPDLCVIEYTDDMNAALGHDYDIAVISGTLQYLDDWRGVINRCNSRFLVIDRTQIAKEDLRFLQTIHHHDGHTDHEEGAIIGAESLLNALRPRWSVAASWTVERIHTKDWEILVGGLYAERRGA